MNTRYLSIRRRRAGWVQIRTRYFAIYLRFGKGAVSGDCHAERAKPHYDFSVPKLSGVSPAVDQLRVAENQEEEWSWVDCSGDELVVVDDSVSTEWWTLPAWWTFTGMPGRYTHSAKRGERQ